MFNGVEVLPKSLNEGVVLEMTAALGAYHTVFLAGVEHRSNHQRIDTPVTI